MPRAPFDPARMKPAPEPDAMRVSELARRIDAALRAGLPGVVRVVGEVSGARERTHWYFDLKDKDAVVSAVFFASAARRTPARPIDGHEFVVSGRVEFYAKQGRATLIVDRLDPVGAGALDLAFRALCAELRALGWFAPERKRPLPGFPRRIAVLTSRSSAALQDVLATMRRRCPGVEVGLVDVRVQGEDAGAEITRAIAAAGIAHARLGIDAILLTRGGGSAEDLWAFNDRGLARAIVDCPIPVVAAIGHETDTTIAELVADARAATPTQAAMLLTPDASAMREQAWALGRRLGASAARLIEIEERRRRAGARALSSALEHARSRATARLERAWRRLEASRPAEHLARRTRRLDAAAARLEHAILARLSGASARLGTLDLTRVALARIQRALAGLQAAERHLHAVGPASVLARGFSITRRHDGGIVRAASDVAPGDTIRTHVADGEFASRVVGTPGSTTKRMARHAQGGLFDAPERPSVDEP